MNRTCRANRCEGTFHARSVLEACFQGKNERNEHIRTGRKRCLIFDRRVLFSV
ncbi:hypothetical protein [Lysobacter gummosus]|uniref:hypothetical protein n=1 Tax=Lysobacter gummosus TaxID=262324 RepID=UPI003633D114